MIEVRKQCQRQKLLILLFKNVLKISNFEKSAKTSENLKNPKKTAKKNFIFFCLDAFTREGKMFLIKIVCFILNFLNWKSKPRHLFRGVASSLSINCGVLCTHHYVEGLAKGFQKTICLQKVFILFSKSVVYIQEQFVIKCKFLSPKYNKFTYPN